MTSDIVSDEQKHKKYRTKGHQAGGAVYGLAFIGALVYFLQHATSFSNGLYGVLKALLWPAFLVHKLLGFLQM